MRNSFKPLFIFGIILTFFIAACDEDPIPVIPDPVATDPEPKEPIDDIPGTKFFDLKVSQVSICSGEKTQILLTDYDKRQLDFKNYNFYFSPEIGELNLDSGYYQAPASLDSAIFIELWAEYKLDTSRKSGKILRLHPNIPESNILRNFNGVTEAVDSEQLPDGSLIFASNNPAEPAGLAANSDVFDFDIFCTDQKGNLLWHKKLGKGTLQRLYVGKDVIYGLGQLNSVGFVVVKFDFQGNHLATKKLEIGLELDYNLLENLKGTINEEGDFFISYGAYSLTMMLKLDNEMNLSLVNPIPIRGEEVYALGDSKLLITGKEVVGGFIVTDLDLNILWEKSSVNGMANITRAFKSAAGWEIWTISSEYSSKTVFLKAFDLSGKLIKDKKLSLNESLLPGGLHDLVQLPNGEIWLVSSRHFYPSKKPFLKDQIFYDTFHLIQLSLNGDFLKASEVASLNFSPPSFPGGFRIKYQGLFLGHDGLLLTGQWFHNFVVQFSPDDRFSPCPF